MPKHSIDDLRSAIEAAPEMTAEHREEMLGLVESLAREIEAGGAESGEHSEKLRGAIAVAGDVVRRRTGSEKGEEDHDLGERLAELEEKAEMVALEHPVIANILAAIGRLV